MRSEGSIQFIFYVILFVIAIGAKGACGSCVGEADSVRAAEKQGWSDVRCTEKSIFFPGIAGCSNTDAAAFNCNGENPRGDRSDLLLCSGWPFKGVTVRTE